MPGLKRWRRAKKRLWKRPPCKRFRPPPPRRSRSARTRKRAKPARRLQTGFAGWRRIFSAATPPLAWLKTLHAPRTPGRIDRATPAGDDGGDAEVQALKRLLARIDLSEFVKRSG